MAKVVVTGGAGFIGSHLVDALASRGDEVWIIDKLEAFKKRYQLAALPETAFYGLGVDIRSVGDMAEVMRDAETVFHLAALPRVQFSIAHPLDTFEVNVRGTQHVLEAARLSGVQRVVFASSSSVYGMRAQMPLKESDPLMPMSPYAAHKLIGETLCQTYTRTFGLDTVCLRYFNVYGPGLDPEGPYALVIGVFLRQWIAGQPLTITGDGTQTRDFTHVDDVVRATMLAADPCFTGHGQAINIGAGRGVSINALADLFLEVGAICKYIEARKEPHDTRADNTLAQRLLGWEPKVRLEDGIAELKQLLRASTMLS